ncbi:MAG: fimbrillin family protein [Alistipes sp.]
MFVAVAAMTFSACSKDQETTTPPQDQGFELKFTVDNQTRSLLGAGDVITWDQDDEIGVFIPTTTPEPTLNQYAFIDLTKSPVVFKTSLKNTPKVGDLLYSYYPYEFASFGEQPSNAQLSIPPTQPQVAAGEFKCNYNTLVGIPVALTSAELKGVRYPAIKFRQLGSMIEFHLYCTNPTYALEKVQSVAFAADKPIAGSFVFDLTTVSETSNLAISGYTGTEVATTLETLAPLSADKATASKVFMVIAPGSYGGAIQVVTNEATYTFNLTTPKTFERAHIKALGIDLAKATVREEKPSEANTIRLTQAEIAGMTTWSSYVPLNHKNSYGTWTGSCAIGDIWGCPALTLSFTGTETKSQFNARIIVPELGGVAQKVVIEMAPEMSSGRRICLTAWDYTYPANASYSDLEAAAKVSSAETAGAGETITFDNLDRLKLTRFAIFPLKRTSQIKSITIYKK